MDEVGRGINRSRGANHQHQRGAVDLALDAVHLQRNLAEEDDVRAQTRATGAAADLSQIAIDCVVLDRRTAAIALAARLRQLAMQVHQARGAGALMQVVDILGAEKEAVAEALLKLRERKMRGVGLGLLRGRAARGVELPHQRRGCAPRLGRADILDGMAPAHKPSEARKVGRPLSALMPAPVSTKTRSLAAMEMADIYMIKFSPRSRSRWLIAPFSPLPAGARS